MLKMNAPSRTGTSEQGKQGSCFHHLTKSSVLRQLIAASALMTAAVPMITMADYDDEPVQVVCLEIIERSQPEAPRYAYREPNHYAWTDDEIIQVAKILWAETGKGNTYREKEAICALILNRTRHGDPFPTDIVSVCRQHGEFNRGKTSNKNREIARECLDRYQSHLDGNFQDIQIPQSAVYMGRVNGTLTLYDINWNKVYEVAR